MPTDTDLTTVEAARIAGVTPQAVTAAIRSGRLRARIIRKPGAARGTWRIARADLAAWQPLTSVSERSRAAAAARWAAEDAEATRRAAILAGTGATRDWGGPTLADFLKEKRVETERDR